MIRKFIFLIFVFGAIGYASYVSLSREQAEINVITPSPTGTVSLGIKSSTTPLIINQEYILSLNYSSLSEHLTAVSSNIKYDPTYLTVTKFTANSSFPTVLAPTKIENGLISFTLGVTVAAGAGIKNEGNLATLTIKPLKTGTTTLTFEDPTLVTVIESSTNAIKSANPLSLTIKNPPLAGDLNNDDTVNILDFNLLIINFGKPYTLLDFNSIIANFGKNR